jgi:hypothetical protein
MTSLPVFPEFKKLTLEDRDPIHERIWAFQPKTSELTFVNLYIWRSYYDFHWSLYEDCLLLVAEHEDTTFALPPVGPGSRIEATRAVLQWMRDERNAIDAFVGRAGHRLVDALEGDPEFVVEATRDHFDYVYRSESLGLLKGRKYSKKRNHINQFLRRYEYTYAPLTEDLVPGCLDLAEIWCKQRMCEDDISLTHEFCGIQDTLNNLKILQVEGGVIVVDGEVRAFALGELLNEETAVVHIEKADPNLHGIYPMITKSFSEQRWQEIAYINREQDVGDLGLRRAKESYYPDHLVEKFEIRLAGS